MNKENLLKILKTILYPGFSRDIVSFGMVKDIQIVNDEIKLILFQSTSSKEILEEIKKNIIEKITILDNSKKINVVFIPSESHKSVNSDSKLKDSIKNIIAIASGKGGVGKSTIAINLASELSKSYKVGLLDLDIYGPSLPTLIGTKKLPEVKNNNILVPVEKFGMKFMSFGFLNTNDDPAIWRGPMVSKLTHQFFDNVDWGELDFLILDLPPGTGDIQLTLVQKIALTGAIIITTPQDLAHKDVQKGSDMFKKVNTPVLGVIENMSYYTLKGKLESLNNKVKFTVNDFEGEILRDKDGNFQVKIDIFKGKSGIKESDRLGIPLLGTIPLNPIISLLSDSGNPFVFDETELELINIFSNISKKVIKLLENN